MEHILKTAYFTYERVQNCCFGGPKKLPWVPDIISNIKARTTAALY